MTTIAYKDACMVSDSQMTNGSIKVMGIHKVFRTNGLLVGIAGPAQRINQCLNWLMRCEELCQSSGKEVTLDRFHQLESPDLGDEEIEMLVVCQTTACVHIVNQYGHCIELGENAPFAIGTGQNFAMGALYHGASAREAVEIAIRLDVCSGGDTTELSLYIP